MGGTEVATFAWRLTVLGAEAVNAAFNSVGKSANQNMGGSAAAANLASAAFLSATNKLEGLAKQSENLQKLKREFLAIAELGGGALLVENSLKMASNMRKFSDETGFAVVPLQEMIFALRQFHVDQDTAVASMTKFSEETAQFVAHNAGTAKQAYETLFGANAQQIAQKGLANVDQFYMQVLDKIGKLKNESQKIELAKEIFGKAAGPALVRAADEGIEKFQALREEAERLGGVFSDDMVNKSEDAEVALGNLGELLHVQLAAAIDENADAIGHMAEVGIEMMPMLISGFEKLVSAAGFAANSIGAIGISMHNLWEIGGNAAQWVLHPTVPKTALPGMLDGVVDPMDAFKPGDGSEGGGLHVTVHPKPPAPGGNAPPRGDDGAAAKLKQEQEAYDKLTYSLKEQIVAMGTSDKEMFINTEMRKLGASATQEQKTEISALAGKLFDEKEAWGELKSAAKSAGDDISSTLQDMTLHTKTFSDALHGLEQSLLSIAYKFFIGDPMSKSITSGLESVFGGSGSSSSSGGGFLDSIGKFFGGGKAAGGPLDPGKWYVAGEHGPEPIWGGGPGAFASGYPASQAQPSRGAGPVFNVDMRGASLEAVTRLEQLVHKVNGSIETRALSAVQQARHRSLNW